jgi:pyruvate dehydrogenase E2 component (dihydrolipoamide acetyltransferase)
MAYEIVMPQLSDSMEEGRLISWKVKEGDRVKVGDVIAEVESDKAIMEVQSFKAGTVTQLLVKAGEDAPVGTVIARIQTDTDAQNTAPSVSQNKTTPEEVPTLSSSPSTEQKVSEPLSETPPPAPVKPAENSAHHPTVEGVASPKAKALAAAQGIDIEALQKSGKLPHPAHEEDLEHLIQKRYFTPKAWQMLEAYHLSADCFPKNRKQRAADVEQYIIEHEIARPIPLSPNQKAVIETVTRAAQKPVYHIYDHIDAALITQHTNEKRTVTVWLLKLIAEAMMQHEAFRMQLGKNGLQLRPYAAISLAMSREGELYMPVLKRIEHMSADDVAQALADLKEKLATRRIDKESLQGSTFGLSNLGMTGIERFDAMINANDAGIAAIGSQIDGKIAVTLTLDHRIVNGYEAAMFVQTLKRLALDEIFFKENL